MEYFESHAHYDDKRFQEDREELLASLPSLGVTCIVNSGSDMRSSKEGIRLSEKFSHVYCAVGVHPHNVKKMTDDSMKQLRSMASNKKVVAIGEIGLDFHYDFSPREEQRHWFQKQLDLAKELDKPVIIHSREASQESFDIIKESGHKKGVIHCYSGGAIMAMDYVEMGYYIGIGGVVTFPTAKKLIEVAEVVPLERIVIETDCPYLTPAPHRGKRNDSSYLSYVVEKLAQIKEVSPEEVAKKTYENGKNLFFS